MSLPWLCPPTHSALTSCPSEIVADGLVLSLTISTYAIVGVCNTYCCPRGRCERWIDCFGRTRNRSAGLLASMSRGTALAAHAARSLNKLPLPSQLGRLWGDLRGRRRPVQAQIPRCVRPSSRLLPRQRLRRLLFVLLRTPPELAIGKPKKRSRAKAALISAMQSAEGKAKAKPDQPIPARAPARRESVWSLSLSAPRTATPQRAYQPSGVEAGVTIEPQSPLTFLGRPSLPVRCFILPLARTTYAYSVSLLPCRRLGEPFGLHSA